MKRYGNHGLLPLPAAAACILSLAAAPARGAGETSEWRGPGRDGLVPDSPALIDALPEGGLKLLWRAELPGCRDGNFSSPVAAGGRVYVHVSWARKEPIAERVIDGNALKPLGCFQPADVPAAVWDRIEAARTGAERAALNARQVKDWVGKWIEGNLDAEQRRSCGRLAEDRLSRGAAAVPPADWRTLAAVGNRKALPDQAALEAWMTEAGLAAETRAQLEKAVAKDRPYREDTLVCLRADTGEVVWRKAQRSANSGWGASNTPCVRDGRVIFIGCNGAVYCLAADSGEELWRNAEAGRDAADCSVAVAEGKVIVLGGRAVVALDAATGAEAWRADKLGAANNSPSVWEHGGKSYVIAAGGQIACLDPADGRVLWRMAGTKWTTPAVSGDTMAVMVSDQALKVYRLGLEGAEETGTHPLKFRACSPATDGARVYAMASRTGVCLDAATGKVLWTCGGNNDTYSSPLVADGKIICNHRRGVIVYSADTGRELWQAPLSFGECMTAGLAGGLLLARDDKGLACYDLRRPPAP